MICEYDRQLLREQFHGDKAKATAEGYYKVWTPASIKAAFGFGKGTQKDFDQYMQANSNLAVFETV